MESPVTRELVMTAEGIDRLERALDELRAKGREAVAERLRQALDTGTELAENDEYLAAKEDCTPRNRSPRNRPPKGSRQPML